MKRGTTVSSFVLAALFFWTSGARAQILAESARQGAAGSWQIAAYYEGVSNEDLNFALGGGSGSCATQNGLSFACGQSGTVSVHGNGQTGLLKATFQPWDGFQYSAAAGAGYYQLSVPAANATQTFSGTGPVFSLGVKDVIFPDTIVTPAVALVAGFAGGIYQMNRMTDSLEAASGVNDTLAILQYRLGLEASHVFDLSEGWKLEPYGGIEWYRVSADLKDATAGSDVGGTRDTLAPDLGLRVPTSDHEGLFVEAAYVGGFEYGGGLSLRF